MRLYIDLGFSGAALLLVLLVGPVVAFLVHQKWRLAEARQAEVRRLALLAAQEAAVAEMEAMASYSATSAAGVYSTYVAKEPSALPECAVCSVFAAARCSRCKIVRYCSGKCQIIHWRRGHKDECQPPPVSEKYNREDELGLEGVQSEQSGLAEKMLEPKEGTEEVERFSQRSAASISSYSMDNLNGVHNEGISSKDVSVKTIISDSFSAPSIIPANLAFSHTINSPNDAWYDGKSLPNIAGAGESSSFTSSLGSVADTGNGATIMSSTPELARSNSLANNSMFSDHSREIPSTSKVEADDLVPSGTSDLKATSSLDHASNEVCVRVGNGFHPSTYSISENYSHESSSSEAISNLESNGTLVSNKKISRYVANGQSTEVKPINPKTTRSSAATLDHYSTNGVTRSFSLYESSSNGNAHRTSSKVSRHYYSELMLFPYDLFIKFYNSDKVNLQPCGLTNCGNSCYANAVLQCLVFTRPLTAYLLEGFHSRICSKQEWCFTCELENLVRNAKEGKSPLSPIGILSHLQNIGSKFGHGQQEDAHEFLRYAIEVMQSICLKEAVAKPDGLLAEETTLIQQTFGGYLQSKLRCARCKGKSEHCERMMDLTVEIGGDISTLDEALLRFTSSETLDGENKYKCDRCNSYERAKKKLTILEAPNVLTIVLKRFQSDNFCKINKAIQFPEYLDLARYMSGDDKSPVYRLYAIIVHLNVTNTSSSGHYICYVKDRQGMWYEIDDSKVKPVDIEKVLSKGAYMLLYSRCLPRAPSSVRKARAHEFVQQARKITRDSKGKPGGSLVSDYGEYLYPYRSDLYGHQNDSASDNSSLFDESSTCSTVSTKESTTTEDLWEHMSGESDCVSPSSPMRISENYDGFTRSRHSSKADVTMPVTDPGQNTSSSGRKLIRWW
ncbi:ubiquitin carboxyl-terminal hydrolase 17-like [Zingiber officinale]|uniref:ubiquitinyl hydrolase 1 n=1 Tax=Zingiber officinale TaxID=94328 RepID=A0A8J5GU80_ZINOF|nr:ubiquitin carboxyl-terminal hydrolase 17-like [Zingiber officinale]KAG6509941.1 hypothetical protein ZIOFF_027949 [Zingiber officinale]